MIRRGLGIRTPPRRLAPFAGQLRPAGERLRVLKIDDDAARPLVLLSVATGRIRRDRVGRLAA